MKIQRLSTSSFKFYSPQGKVVLVDPWLTGDPFWPEAERTPEKLREIDVIAITHAHFDHATGVGEIVRQNEKVFVIAQYEYALILLGRGTMIWILVLGCGTLYFVISAVTRPPSKELIDKLFPAKAE